LQELPAMLLTTVYDLTCICLRNLLLWAVVPSSHPSVDLQVLYRSDIRKIPNPSQFDRTESQLHVDLKFHCITFNKLVNNIKI
jgi:hypothetical protein